MRPIAPNNSTVGQLSHIKDHDIDCGKNIPDGYDGQYISGFNMYCDIHNNYPWKCQYNYTCVPYKIKGDIVKK